MLLRRVIDHVKTQNWTAVALDFVIVVVGVFIGIQLGNWNEARADRRLAHQYVERLTADLTKDLAATHRLVGYFGAVLESVERTNELLKDPGAAPAALVAAAYRASEVNYVPPTHATWDQLVSSGHLKLLPERVVDSGLADYFAFDTPLAQFNDLNRSAYRRRVREIIPLDLQKALRAGCSDVRDETQGIAGFMQSCDLDIDAAMVRKAADELRADPEVLRTLRYQYSDVVSTYTNISGNLVFLERALSALKAST